MHIAYCTNVRLPSERAHGHQIAQVCSALAKQGHAVTVFTPFRRNPIKETFREYYGVSSDISVQYLGTFDPINRFWLPGILGLYALNTLLNAEYKKVLRSMDFDLLYTREPALLETLLATGIPVIVELHRLPSRSIRTFIKHCRRCRLVVCLTSVMKAELIRLGGDPANIIVEGDAYDASLFAHAVSKKEAHTKLHIDQDRPVIVYTGQLVSMGLSKGIPELLAALRILHEKNVPFQALIAGGPESAKIEFSSSLSESMQSMVTFLGSIAHTDVPNVLAAGDVLIYPAPKSNHPFYNRDTSPLKLFEYMAAHRPIVCADLPPLRDIINQEIVTLCEPGNPQALADAIEWVIKHPEEADEMAEKAHTQGKSHTWDARMKRVMEAATLHA
jgi:glycosyltransferase involved in cell wall biosynthesis